MIAEKVVLQARKSDGSWVDIFPAQLSEMAKEGYEVRAVPTERNLITDYWHEHYVNRGMCSLCGNSGIIDTRGARTPAGLEVGRVNFCICPNGQSMREHGGDRPRGVFTRIKK
jgi:hypothetical protein